MKKLDRFKKSHADYIGKKIELIKDVQEKCKDGRRQALISRRMGKTDSYVHTVLFERSYISDETLILIAETVGVMDAE